MPSELLPDRLNLNKKIDKKFLTPIKRVGLSRKRKSDQIINKEEEKIDLSITKTNKENVSKDNNTEQEVLNIEKETKKKDQTDIFKEKPIESVASKSLLKANVKESKVKQPIKKKKLDEQEILNIQEETKTKDQTNIFKETPSESVPSKNLLKADVKKSKLKQPTKKKKQEDAIIKVDYKYNEDNKKQKLDEQETLNIEKETKKKDQTDIFKEKPIESVPSKNLLKESEVKQPTKKEKQEDTIIKIDYKCDTDNKKSKLDENSNDFVVKPKLMKRSLSLKSSSSNQKLQDIESSRSKSAEIKPCTVILEKNLENLENAFISQLDKEYEEQTTNKDETLNVKPPITKEDVTKLEKRVIEKRKLLESLKRVDEYKKLHNVKDLEEMTDVWKNGCISALNDLLPQINNYAEIDMKGLLQNLNVPSTLIKVGSDGELQ